MKVKLRELNVAADVLQKDRPDLSKKLRDIIDWALQKKIQEVEIQNEDFAYQIILTSAQKDEWKKTQRR